MAGDAPDERADRRVVWALAAGAVAVVVALVLVVGTRGEDDPSPAQRAETTSTTIDLSAVTDEQLEQVVNEHPEVVPMRLRLVERLIRAQEFERARVHAEEAAVRSTTVEERSRALTWLGLTTAILGDPAEGEGILVQALALDPTNREGIYNLARVRLDFLDPAGAIGPLEQLLSLPDLTEEQTALFTDMLARAQAAAGVAALTTTTTAPPP